MEYYGAPITYLEMDGKVIDSPITTKADIADWACNALHRSQTTRRPTPPNPLKVDEEPTARIEALLTAQPLHRR
jgi:hypothetical protein